MKKIVISLILVCLISLVKADNYHVTTVADTGVGSLRAAIDSANAHAGLDSIIINLSPSDTIKPLTGPYVIKDSLVITAGFCENVTIAEDSAIVGPGFLADTFLVVNNINMMGFHYIDGNASSGAAIQGGTYLGINNCFFYGNHADEGGLVAGPGNGGAVYAVNVFANNCTFYANGSGGHCAETNWGGAVCANYGEINNCTFYRNYTYSNVGTALFLFNGGIVHHCIFYQNSGLGGALMGWNNVDSLGISNNIFWSDTATAQYPAEIMFIDTVLSGGCNVFADSGTDSTFVLASTDVSGLDPQFGPLGYYQGCVPTLRINNPAVLAVFDSCPVPKQTTAILRLQSDEPLILSIYPNPVTSNSFQLVVKLQANDMACGNAGFAVEIFDEQGRVVSNSIIPSTSAVSGELKSEIHFNGANGIYFLRLSFAGGSVIQKLVKI